MALPEEDGDEEGSGYSSGPASILEDAGFDPEQAAALVEAMRACYDEEREASEAPPSRPSKGGKEGKGLDLAIVFGKPKGAKR